jgi:Rad3-related DNA helicase
MPIDSLPLSPQDLGMPEKFAAWRRCQEQSINRCLNQEQRFQIHAQPTGSGKSASYIGTALLSQERTLILTSTKALQTQLSADFGSIGIADLRGRSNYRCRMSKTMTCEEGKHAGCSHSKTTACPHTCAREVAKASQIVVTNYACWMSNNLYGEGLGRFDALVLDEAHNAPDEVCSMIGVEITTEEAYGMLNGAFPEREEATVWRDWARNHLPKAEGEKEAIARIIAQTGDTRVSIVKDLAKWGGLCRKLGLVAGMAGPWVVEASRKGYRLDPLWPSQYAEKILFAGIPKVYAYSATVTPKSLHIMGVRPEELEYFEYASSFPPKRSPVYRIPTTKVDRHMDASGKALWLSRIDQIVRGRQDRKGIIHCVSYARSDEIINGCETGDLMTRHSPEDTAQTIEWFRASKPPLVLVSPSVTTGYDFPGTDCQFQIIAKVPWPDNRAKIMKARAKADPLYLTYLTVQNLIQSTGRGMRFHDDQCENFVVDDHIARLLASSRDQFLLWWMKLYRRANTIPDPPKALENGHGLGGGY